MCLGDFNMILCGLEKSNRNINRTMMTKFQNFDDDQELKELYMHGHKFTWSNERNTPTLTKIDRMLVSVEWELAFPDYLMQALSTSVSDHAPLHLSTSNTYGAKRRFRFELYWTKLEGFEEAIREAWVCSNAIFDTLKRLDRLFGDAAAYLASWGREKFGDFILRLRRA